MQYDKWVKVTYRHTGYGKWDYLIDFKSPISFRNMYSKLVELYGPPKAYSWYFRYWENKSFATNYKRRIYIKEDALVMLTLLA